MSRASGGGISKRTCCRGPGDLRWPHQNMDARPTTSNAATIQSKPRDNGKATRLEAVVRSSDPRAQRSASPKSDALCHPLAGSFCKHRFRIRSMRREPVSASPESGAGSCSRIAAMSPACELASNVLCPVCISRRATPKAHVSVLVPTDAPSSFAAWNSQQEQILTEAGGTVPTARAPELFPHR